jgi:hypothetical protein
MSQCDRIVRHLEDHGSITAVEAMQEYGIQRLAARIADLRANGVPITSEIVTGKNRYDEITHYAAYRLKKTQKVIARKKEN